MPFKLAHLNKYFRWMKKESKAFRQNARISREYAVLCRDFDVAMLRSRPEAEVDRKAHAKHEYILNYLRKLCPDTVTKYRGYAPPVDVSLPQKEIKIWSMWWQGEENADELFRMCINSTREHTHLPVTVLNRDNYTDYFTIPEALLEKQRQGKIALQHICDLMVVSILASQGGFFCGATVWCSKDIPESVLRAPFYTCRKASPRTFYMSRSRWTGYVLAGNREFPLFSFARDFLIEYWSKTDVLIDYLLLDYVFELAYEEIPCVKALIDALPDNNPERNTLINELGVAYDPDDFQKYSAGETFLYKLSWKFGSKAKLTPDGRLTNYGHMLEAIDKPETFEVTT